MNGGAPHSLVVGVFAMYLDYWRLDFPPFADDHKLDAFVPTRSATLVMGRVRFALGAGQAVAGLYGAAGVGKTIITRMILAEYAEARWLTAYLPSPCCQARDVLAALSPGSALLAGAKAGMSDLFSFLESQAEAGRPVLLAVDDIQATRNSEFLELLRTLLNVESGGRRALSLLLAGQPSMDLRLAAASGFDGQLAVRAVVQPMTNVEAGVYILSRLKAAGSHQGLFTRQAAERVVQLAHGLPRDINRLCELSLVIAYGLGLKKIDPATVEMAAADLDLLPGDDAPFFAWSAPERPARPEPEVETVKTEAAGVDILASLPAQ